MAKQVSYIIAIFINDNLGKTIKVYKNFAEIAQLWYNNSRYFEKNFGVPASGMDLRQKFWSGSQEFIIYLFIYLFGSMQKFA